MTSFKKEFTRSESILDQYWPLDPSAKSTTKEEGEKKERRRKTFSCGMCTLRDGKCISGNINFDISGSCLHFAITTFVCLFFLLFLPMFE
jgi:hypothetical protein